MRYNRKSQNLFPIRVLTLLSVIGLLTSCDRYTFTLNQQPFFEPEKLYTGYQVTDLQLRECIQQHIKDQLIITATGLTFLRCSHAGIKDLSGIEGFPSLRKLDLTGNRINNLQKLYALGQLTEVDLSENPLLSCQDIDLFAGQTQATVKTPTHCQE